MKEKIYLLPGLITDDRLWKRLKPFLEDDFELIHLSLPLTDDFKEASIELSKTIKDEKINLLGFSLGAYLATYFTINNPNRVNRLFLVAGTASEMKKDEIEKRKQTLSLSNNLKFKGLSHKKVLSLIEKSNKDDEELIKTIKDMFIDLGQNIYNIQMNSTFKRKDLHKEMISLCLPIRIFYSTKDSLFNHNSLDHFTSEHKHIIKVSREGISHMLPLDVPKELSLEIREWMKN
jgi:pimeloyl-ACP methyl ester carboxylesterase